MNTGFWILTSSFLLLPIMLCLVDPSLCGEAKSTPRAKGKNEPGHPPSAGNGRLSLIDTTLVGESNAPTPQGGAGDRVLVLGVGNLLMGDEGVGIHILRTLEQEAAVPGVRLLDGGTGGVNLLTELDGADDVVLIDATRDGRPAGTITFLRPEFVGELPRGLGAHDFGLKDLFAASALTGRLPRIHLFTIAVEEVSPMCTELSAAVAAAVPEVTHTVRALVARLAGQKP